MLSISSWRLAIANRGLAHCMFLILDTNGSISYSVFNIPSHVQPSGQRNLGLYGVMVRSREHAPQFFPNGAAPHQSLSPTPHTVTLTVTYTSSTPRLHVTQTIYKPVSAILYPPISCSSTRITQNRINHGRLGLW
jgi:hypothetical protein